MMLDMSGGTGTRTAPGRQPFRDPGSYPGLALRPEAARRFRHSMSGNHEGNRLMDNATTKSPTTSIKSIMAGGVWRSRRVVAALAITAGLTLGAAGTAIPQAEAGVGWCMRCTVSVPVVETESAKPSFDVYTVRRNVYPSTY